MGRHCCCGFEVVDLMVRGAPHPPPSILRTVEICPWIFFNIFHSKGFHPAPHTHRTYISDPGPHFPGTTWHAESIWGPALFSRCPYNVAAHSVPYTDTPIYLGDGPVELFPRYSVHFPGGNWLFYHATAKANDGATLKDFDVWVRN